MRDFGADAGADVTTQGLRADSQGLPEDDFVSEVAKDDRPSR